MQPLPIDVKAGETYWWCRCGESAKQPFCDGSHKGGTFAPMKYTAADSRKALVLRLQKTATPPLCDGSHKSPATPSVD